MSDKTLNDEVELYYRNYYERVHSSGTLGLANRIMHKKLEKNSQNFHGSVLELGSGNFEHYSFVKHQYDEYIASDVRRPPQELVDKFLNKHEGNVFQVEDATKLSFPDDSFDRVLAGCLLVHLVEINTVIKEWIRVAKDEGQIDFVVPCDPGILLRLFRKMISIPQAKKFGVTKDTYEKINSFEHVSSFPRTLRLIETEIKDARRLKIRYFPFPFLRSWNLNAFAIVTITGKNLD